MPHSFEDVICKIERTYEMPQRAWEVFGLKTFVMIQEYECLSCGCLWFGDDDEGYSTANYCPNCGARVVE